MTSMISREDLTDQLYQLAGPHKARHVPRFMKLVELYAVTLAKKTQPTTEWHPDPYRALKPGETDATRKMRKCAGCGETKKLNVSFEKDSRAPLGRKLRCIVCRPKRVRKREQYYCKRCGERYPIYKFPYAKRENPRRILNCLNCAS